MDRLLSIGFSTGERTSPDSGWPPLELELIKLLHDGATVRRVVLAGEDGGS
jgi:hypothetical protein